MQDVGQSFGIGVGEDTALYINRDTATCLGNDGVWIIDSSRATFPTETYFAAKNLRMTYLTEGDTYTLSTKKVTSTKSQITSTSGRAYESDKVFDGPEGIDAIKSLVTSTDSQSVGYSYEERPTARVVFRKGEGEISYADSSRSKFTVDDLSFDIGSITLAKSSRHHGLKLESSRH
jgi:cyanophycinase